MDGRDTSLEDAMSTIARQALRITKLEDENAALRAQIGSQPQDLSATRPSNDDGEDVHPAAFGTYSREQYESLAQTYKDVQSQFENFKSQHAGCEEKMKMYLAKCKEYKDYAKGWKEWGERQVGKKPQKETRTFADLPADQRAGILLSKKHHAAYDRPQLASDDPQEPPLTPVSLAEARPDDEATLRPNAESPTFPSSPPPLCDKGAPHIPSRLGVSRVTSSQTTVDDTPTQDDTVAPLEQDASSDNEPIFVSARSLKRKGNTSIPSERPAQRIKEEPKSQEGPIELNSSPQQTPERSLNYEISDLDAVGTRMITPRRPQRVSELRQRASSEEVVRPRPTLIRNASSHSEGDEPGDRDEQHRATNTNTNHSNSATRRPSHGNNQTPSHGPLRPISANIPTGPRTSSRPPNKKSKVRRTGAREKVRLLSEDGEEASQLNSEQAEDVADNLLEDLLNEPPPERTPALTRRAHEPLMTSRKSRQQPHMPTPESIIKRPSPQKLWRRPLRRPRQNWNSPPPVRPEDEPLRNQPLASLRLEDFKINPKYMGTTHAFTDTLRGRDARRGLHTCTRADCCGGALQKVIAIGGTNMTGKTDAEALEAFLGKDWQDHMSGYSPEKRKEIVTQAHVFILANQHGKHKAAFERRSTPPGFWDTDFPTTQQVNDNRSKVEEMERQQVEGRWREAMREGGRWLFRDE